MKLFISFSGGETSAYMAQWLLANKAKKYTDIICMFANTGQENEETVTVKSVLEKAQNNAYNAIDYALRLQTELQNSINSNLFQQESLDFTIN